LKDIRLCNISNLVAIYLHKRINNLTHGGRKEIFMSQYTEMLDINAEKFSPDDEYEKNLGTPKIFV